MSFLVGIRNLLLRLVYRAFRPLIFLMDPENAHYAFKRVGVFLGSNFITRFITRFFFDYGHKSLKTNVDGIYAIGDVVRGMMLAHKAEEVGFGDELVAVVVHLMQQPNHMLARDRGRPHLHGLAPPQCGERGNGN